MSEVWEQGSLPDDVTYCGLYCGACAMGNGEIRNTAADLETLLQMYSYGEWAPSLVEFVPAVQHWTGFEQVLEWLKTQSCIGCRAGGGDPECAIRACAVERGFEGCWACPDDGCEKLQRIDAFSPMVPKSRQVIREIGMEEWGRQQAEMVETGFSYFKHDTQ